MVELIYNNDTTVVSGAYDKSIIDLVSDTCSYFVPNADWSEKYQTGVWNGKISLFSKKTMSFPSGLIQNIENLFKESKIDFIVTDKRLKPTVSKNAKLNESIIFRDYQCDSIKIFNLHQRGILALCTGAGKTKTSCGLIVDISVYPVVFVVPSISLLKQTITEFTQCLLPLNDNFFIGELGGGVCNIADQGVTVATYQTLLTAYDKKYSDQKKKVIDIEVDKNSLESLQKQKKILTVDFENSPANKLKSIEKKIKDVDKKIANKLIQHNNKQKIRDLMSKNQFLIIDETHIAAEVIEALSLRSSKAFYRCGLSATPERTDNQELRMFGCTGPVIKKVSSSDLIKQGYLVKPYIYVVDLDFLNKSASTYQETYKNAIVLSEQRNELIKDFSQEMHKLGRPTLILVERIEHGKILEELIENSIFVPGKDGSDDMPISDEELDYRRYQLNRLENNEKIMIATQWANQGIDAPKVSALVLAGSTSSPITVIQQVGRVLRKADGKTDCIVLDFKMKEKSLRNHSNSRIKTLKEEKEFVVKVIKYSSIKGEYV